MMNIWAVLLAVHLLYDWHWQGEFIGVGKSKYDLLLIVHALTWTVLLCLVLQYYGKYQDWMWSWLFLTHLAIDFWKCRMAYEASYGKKFFTKAVLIDQALHIIAFLPIAYYLV